MAFFFEFLLMALAPVAVWLIGEWMERRRRARAAARPPLSDGAPPSATPPVERDAAR